MAYLFRAAPMDWRDPLWQDEAIGVSLRADRMTTGTLMLEGRWESAADGLRPLDAEATLVYTAANGPWAGLDVLLGGRGDGEWLVRVARGGARTTLVGVRVGETREVRGEDSSVFRVTGEPLEIEVSPRGTPQPDVLLTRLGVRLRAVTPPAAEVNWLGCLYGALLPFAVYAFLVLARRRPAGPAVAIAGLAGILMAWVAAHYPAVAGLQFGGTIAFFAGAAVGGMFAIRGMIPKGADPARVVRSPLAVEWCVGLAVVGIAVAFRWSAFLDQRYLPLLPDARGYLQIALEGSFYSTAQDHAPWVREPLFPALVRLWMAMVPPTEVALRAGSAVLGLLPVALTWMVGRRLFAPAVGLLAAAAMAANPTLAQQSVQGLRDDLLAALLLGALAVIVYTPRGTWLRPMLLAVLGAALVLTRIGFLYALVPLLAFEAWRSRWHPLQALAAVLVIVLPVIPHLAFNARLSGGDWFYSSNVHMAYYLNRAHIGEPGFPATFAEWNADPYVGGTVSLGEFVARHGLLRSAVSLLHGYTNIFLWRYPHGILFGGMEWLMLPGLTGAWVVLRRWRELWYPGAWFLVALFPVAVVAPITLDYRLALPAAPLILWVWGAGVAFVVAPIDDNLKARASKP